MGYKKFITVKKKPIIFTMILLLLILLFVKWQCTYRVVSEIEVNKITGSEFEPGGKTYFVTWDVWIYKGFAPQSLVRSGFSFPKEKELDSIKAGARLQTDHFKIIADSLIKNLEK